MTAFDSLSARELAAAISDGDLSAREVAEASLEAISARESEVQAFLQ